MWDKVLLEFAALLGFAALVALIVNILKFFKVVKDDEAQKWSLGFNLVGILALYIFRLFRPELSIEGVDKILLEIATVGTYVLGIVSQLGISKLTHTIVKGIPVIGKSFSFEASKKLKLPV